MKRIYYTILLLFLCIFLQAQQLTIGGYGEAADEIVIAEVGFELIGLHQHRVSFDEVVVKGGLLHHLGHSDEGKHQDDGK